MKKLIAISVVFALIAVAAFAQPSMGGQVKSGVVLIGGGNGADDAWASGRSAGAMTGVINARAGDENVGGFVRVHSRAGKGPGADAGGDYYSPEAFAFAWWKPIDQLRLQFGHNPDADWGAAKITGWGYNAEAQDFAAIDTDSGELQSYHKYGVNAVALKGARAWGFYGGFKAPHAVAISILPMDGLAINIGLPFTGDSNGGKVVTVKEQYMLTHVQVAYSIAGTGQLTITYEGKGEDKGGEIFGSFYFAMIEGLGIDLGVNYSIPPKGADGLPIKIGLGAKYDAGDFGVKARFGFSLAGKDKQLMIGIGLLPYYNLGALTAFLNIGVGLQKPDGVDMIMDWYVNPYIAVPAGGAKFFAGIKLIGFDKDAHGGDGVGWQVPIGLNYYF